MADYVTLMGAEQVSNAAHTMKSAAHEMQNAAGSIAHAFDMHHRWMEDWLQQFQQIVELGSVHDTVKKILAGYGTPGEKLGQIAVAVGVATNG